MEISVIHAGGHFRLQLGHTSITLGRSDVLQLATAIENALLPAPAGREELVEIQTCRVIVDRFRGVADDGLRVLLRELSPKTLQMLFQLAKDNPPLLAKIEANLSKRAFQVLQEDVTDRFATPVPVTQLREAMDDIASHSQRLELEGILQFHGEGEPEISV
jgi:hypothetical protein